MNTVVVTGATSMLGCALIRSMLRHDVRRVYAVMQPGSKNAGRLPSAPGVKRIELNCEEYERLPEMIDDKCDVFYHLAWIPASKGMYYGVETGYRNIGQTLKALEAAHSLGAKTFVGAGSQAEYGNRRKAIQSPDDPADPVTSYAIAKDACRRLLMIKGQELDIAVQWVRIFSVYGPNDRKGTMISTVLPKLLKSENVRLTACEQIWEFLYEDDAGEGLYYAGLSRGSNIYCLGSGAAKPLREFVQEMKRTARSDSELFFGAVPYAQGAVMNLHADIQKLRSQTGWPGPRISFEAGIAAIIEGMRPAQGGTATQTDSPTDTQ